MRKRTLIIVFVALLLFAVGGFGAYFLFTSPEQEKGAETTQITERISQSKEVSTQPEETTSPPKEPTTTEPVDTSDWKTYRNEKYGYEIRYPHEYAIQIDEEGGVYFFAPGYLEKCQPHCPIFFSIHITETDVSLEEWIFNEWPSLKEIEEFEMTPEESGWGIDCIKKATIGKDIEGYLIHAWAQAWGMCHYYGMWRNLLVHILRAQGGLTCSNCNSDMIFNKMLSTFRFIKY